MAYKTQKPQASVPETSSGTVLQIGDPIGGFAGYLRRAKSSSSGLLAQIFGENGRDADVITALHLTQHLDNWVKVTVWMVKDRNGRITKDDKGQHVKLTEFIGTVRRPQPSNMGQVAQFFGENGPQADAINVLNKSEYLDALVYVEMQQAAPGLHVQDIGAMQQAPSSDMEELRDRLTPQEAQELKGLQKRSEDAWKILRSSGFFRMEAVYQHLGRETDFEQWLTGETCCHPGGTRCDNTPVHAWRIPGGRKFSFIPLCREHMDTWENGVTELADGSSPEAFLATHKITYIQRWTQQALRQKLKVPAGHTPTPHAIFAWALERNIDNIIPGTFKTYLV